MTYPVTAVPSVHTDTTGAAASSTTAIGALQGLRGFLGGLPADIIQGVLNAIYQAFTGLENFGNVALTDVETVIENFITTTGTAIDDLVTTTEHLGVQIETAVANAITTAVNDATGLVTAVVTAEESALALITGIFRAILGLLGNPSVASTVATAVNTNIAETSASNIDLLLGLLNTTNPIPMHVLKALAPASSNNLLADPGFDKNNPVYGSTGFSDVAGQGLWAYDGWLGNAKPGSVRTIRPGLIIIYYVVGTSQTGAPGSNPGQQMAYLQAPQYKFIIDWLLTGTDQTRFEWVLVPYPAAVFWMNNSVNIGTNWLVSQIKQTPGKFILVGDSQGCVVCGNVYDQIRFGSLQDRRSDFLGAVMTGSMRRQKDHYFPGMPDALKSPGTSGMCDVCPPIGPYGDQGNPFNPEGGNLIDCEDIWWDMAAPGDLFACCPIGGELGLWMRIVIDFVFQDIRGDFQAGLNLLFANGIIGGIIRIITDVITAIQLIFSEFPITSPHNSYWSAAPRAALGDNRTYAQIGLDYIETYAATVTPPFTGTQHQLLGQRFACQPFQVVTAGASVMWTNVIATGPQILVAVNAYDSDNNLLATVTSPGAIVTNPVTTTNWNWFPLLDTFVMPAGTASACIVFVVEPQAMTTGIVWFDDAIFELDSQIDARFLGNIPGIPQLNANSVAGIQGIADMESAIQHVIDSLASANTATTVSGVELSQMFATQASLALQSSTAYGLGVVNNQLVSNVSVQPIYNGLQPTGEATFKLTEFTAGATLPNFALASGNAMAGFLNCAQPATKGFIEFIAKGIGGSGVYVNVYQVDQSTGAWTRLYNSSDISSSIPNGSYGWVSIVIPTINQVTVTQNEVIALEIVAQSTSINVAAQTWAIPARTSTIATNMGTTRTTASKGISPASMVTTDLTYVATVPWVQFGVDNLPPNYEPPAQESFTNGAGIYSYTIPAWVVSGQFIDIVGLAGGGGGGDYAVTTAGQGALGGNWDGATETFGTGIPGGTTHLDVIVGGAGAGGSTGYPTLVGYGLGSTPAFDTVGTAQFGTNVSSISFTYTATAGAFVMVAITWVGQLASASYGTTIGQAKFTQAYVGGHGDGFIVFGNVPGGTQTVTIGASSTFGYISVIPISYTGVESASILFGGVTTYYAALNAGFSIGSESTALSISAKCSSGQRIVQMFGCGDQSATLSGFTGGTNRGYGVNGTHGAISLSDSTIATPTFTATANASVKWAGYALVLNPTLSTKLIHPVGGTGGFAGTLWPNAINTNNSSTGQGAGTEMFAGKTYYGGNAVTALGSQGSFPGGGSPGGSATALPGPGADGVVYITARQT